MEKISLADRVRNKEVSLRVKEKRGRLTGLVTFCVDTAFYDRLLKER
jgi:hypothetical protein